MKRVTGLGGVFYKVADPEKHKEWYRKHLGVKSDQYGGGFVWRDRENPNQECVTAWSPHPQDTDYFGSAEQQIMVNYRVHDLVKLLEVLQSEGVEIVGEMQEFEYGKFAWIKDLEGNKVELWEPIDKPLVDYADGIEL